MTETLSWERRSLWKQNQISAFAHSVHPKGPKKCVNLFLIFTSSCSSIHLSVPLVFKISPVALLLFFLPFVWVCRGVKHWHSSVCLHPKWLVYFLWAPCEQTETSIRQTVLASVCHRFAANINVMGKSAGWWERGQQQLLVDGKG